MGSENSTPEISPPKKATKPTLLIQVPSEKDILSKQFQGQDPDPKVKGYQKEEKLAMEELERVIHSDDDEPVNFNDDFKFLGYFWYWDSRPDPWKAGKAQWKMYEDQTSVSIERNYY